MSAPVHPVVAARGQLPELIPSDATNLADSRVPCTACGGGTPEPACRICRGRGHTAAPTGREHLSHSSLTVLLNCQQRYSFQYDQRLEPVTRSVPRELGTAFQLAVEHGDPEVGVAHLHAAQPVATEEREVEEAIVAAAATLYLELYGQVESSEVEYRVRLRNPWTGAYSRTFDLLGYADGVSDEGSWLTLVENKLVGQIDQVSIRKLPLDRQLALARYGLWRATGKQVREVRYRYTRKPSIKQKQNESLAAYCDRIAADYEDRPEFYCREEHLLTGNDDLVRTEAELWSWAQRLRDARADRVWPRNTSHCHDFGGCPYMTACLGDPDAPALYQVREER